MKKSFIIGFVLASVLSAGIVCATEYVSNVILSPFPIQLNGKAYTPEMPILNYQGRTYLALREFGTVTNNEIDFVNNTIIINSSKTSTSGTTTPSTTQVTLGEKNALSKAKSYLSFTSFSQKSLYDQLEYEGFTEKEITYAIENCGADWYEQAAKKAKSYLQLTSFSRKSLIEQLEYEGFTPEQAEYGVKSVGY